MSTYSLTIPLFFPYNNSNGADSAFVYNVKFKDSTINYRNCSEATSKPTFGL